MSRLYEYNACIDQRNNNFTSYPTCTTPTTNYANNSVKFAGEATCRRVFDSGAQELLLLPLCTVPDLGVAPAHHHKYAAP